MCYVSELAAFRMFNVSAVIHLKLAESVRHFVPDWNIFTSWLGTLTIVWWIPTVEIPAVLRGWIRMTLVTPWLFLLVEQLDVNLWSSRGLQILTLWLGGSGCQYLTTWRWNSTISYLYPESYILSFDSSIVTLSHGCRMRVGSSIRRSPVHSYKSCSGPPKKSPKKKLLLAEGLIEKGWIDLLLTFQMLRGRKYQITVVKRGLWHSEKKKRKKDIHHFTAMGEKSLFGSLRITCEYAFWLLFETVFQRLVLVMRARFEMSAWWI